MFHGTAVPWYPPFSHGCFATMRKRRVLLCRQIELHGLFHRRENAEIALKAHIVVVADVLLNHIYKALSICELMSVVPFAL